MVVGVPLAMAEDCVTPIGGGWDAAGRLDVRLLL